MTCREHLQHPGLSSTSDDRRPLDGNITVGMWGTRRNICHIDGPHCTGWGPISCLVITDWCIPTTLWLHLAKSQRKKHWNWKDLCKGEGLLLFLGALGNWNNPLSSVLSKLSPTAFFHSTIFTGSQLCTRDHANNAGDTRIMAELRKNLWLLSESIQFSVKDGHWSNFMNKYEIKL